MIGRRAGLEKQPGTLELAFPARDEQRRDTILRGLVDRCASLAEQPDAAEVAVLARDEQRGSAAARRRPDARAGFEQQPHRLGLPVPSGPGEQRVLRVGVEPRVETAARPPQGEEGSQRGQVPTASSASWVGRRAPLMPPEKKKSRGLQDYRCEASIPDLDRERCSVMAAVLERNSTPWCCERTKTNEQMCVAVRVPLEHLECSRYPRVFISPLPFSFFFFFRQRRT